MNEYIKQDYNRAVTADPRITQLAEIAYEVLREAAEGADSADAVYGDLKPYLARLVGWGRSGPAPELGRLVFVADLPSRLLPVIERPYTGPLNEEEFLRSDRAYDVCHDVIFTNLCDIYDRRQR